MSKVEMEIATADTTRVKMSDIHSHPENPRYHSRSQIEELAQSLRDHGYASISLTVSQATGNIVKGNGIYEALTLLGCKEVDVVYMDMTPLEELQFLIRDNRLSELSRWDLPVLNANLALLGDEGFELEDVGFELEAITQLEDEDARRQADNRVVVEDDPPEVDEGEPVTQYGDLWTLGKHRLLCGDSTVAEDVERVMDGEKADMVFTDPPYGISYGAKNRMLNSFQPSGSNLSDIEGDDLNENDLRNMLTKAFTLCKEQSADHCSYYVTAPQGGSLGLMMMMMMDSGLPIKHVLIWVKNQPGFSLNRLDYDYQHEPILYTWNKKHEFYRGGNQASSTWFIDRPREAKEHPTMKPVALVANALLNSSKEAHIVLDMFLGSGTTLIAADQLDRICYGLEISEKYCDVIVKRYINHVGSLENASVQRNGKTLTWEQAQNTRRVKVA